MLQGCVVHEAGLRGHQMHCNGEGCVGGSRKVSEASMAVEKSQELRMQWLFSVSTSILSLLLVLMERVGLAEGGRVLVLGLRTTWGTVSSWGRDCNLPPSQRQEFNDFEVTFIWQHLVQPVDLIQCESLLCGYWSPFLWSASPLLLFLLHQSQPCLLWRRLRESS